MRRFRSPLHGVTAFVGATALLAGGVALMRYTTPADIGTAHAAALPAVPAESLDESQYTLVELVRVQAGLDNDALAATGLSEQSLISVLTNLRQWTVFNTGRIEAARSGLGRARSSERQSESLVSRGGEATSTAGELTRQRALAQAAWETVLQDARAAALQGASPEIAARVDAMRVNSLPLPYRLMSLDSAQVEQVRSLLSQRNQHSLTQSRETSSAAAHDAEIQQVVGATQFQAARAEAELMSVASVRVVAALNAVLPRPASLD